MVVDMKLENIEWVLDAPHMGAVFGLSNEQCNKVCVYVTEMSKIHENSSDILRVLVEVADFSESEMVFGIYLVGFLCGKIESTHEMARVLHRREPLLGAG